MRTSRALTLAVVLAAAWAATAAPAQDDPAARAEQAEQAATEAVQTRAAAQQDLDRWAAERAELQARWDAAAAQVEYLEQRATLERERVAALEAAGQELARRLEESRRLEASLEDTLLVILDDLEDLVAHDLPFLPEERAARLDRVRGALSDPGATPADKLRRTLEAVLIEARYGGTLEVSQDRIRVGGEELTCDLLMVGRLGLFWLTPDRARGGAWDPAQQAFTEQDGEALDSIRRAVDMATRRRPAGVLPLPLGTVEP
jgi:hypothetical protein